MVTRDDVARVAGVSSAVVSYVVNGGPRPVAADTAERVWRAIEQLGYRPNGVARALATNRTFALAFIVPDTSNSFFATLSRYVETAAFQLGYTVLLGNTMEEQQREIGYVETFRQRGVDGFVIAPTAIPSDALGHLAAGDDRVVLIDRDGGRQDISRVLVANEDGGYIATKHLLEHGHTRIACLLGPIDVNNTRMRGRGWQRALVEAGESTDGLFIHTDVSREQAYHGTLELLDRTPTPTAIFTTADEQALGVYRAARERGVRIPDDIALVSFDSADTAPYLNPGLTAVGQPLRQMAELAVQRLVGQFKDPKVTCDVLPVELVTRGSCGCVEPTVTVRSQISA
ncbi:LacI family transcriptional regulator [Rhodococcus sp. 27YEA15]|uniref:LacI family DNA-binding transcriptional regulator n=1 Tax=Rhodococcus sp. 27YEA15 TaxID=3156259 RepID=UPI003C7E45EB